MLELGAMGKLCVIDADVAVADMVAATLDPRPDIKLTVGGSRLLFSSLPFLPPPPVLRSLSISLSSHSVTHIPDLT